MHDTFGVKQMYYSDSSLNMYQSRLQLCILKCVSIQIQLSLYSQVCINPDTTLSVFLSMYQSRYNSMYSQVCINPDTTPTVFLSMFLSRYYSLKLYIVRYGSDIPVGGLGRPRCGFLQISSHIITLYRELITSDNN